MTDKLTLNKVSRVDSATVRLLEQGLQAAKEGRITGVFLVGQVEGSTYATNYSDSLNTFAGRGMVAAAAQEFIANVIDADGLVFKD